MLKMCTGCHEKFLSCLCIDCSEMKIERYLLVEYPDEIEETIKTKIIPSAYHAWDSENFNYILTEGKKIEWQNNLISTLRFKRDSMLETGTDFEDKIIKGRTQDLADARACLDECENNGSTFLAFSSGEVENPITDPERMNYYL